MKLIKISTDLELSVHEFPVGTYGKQNEVLRELIGNDCRVYEHVMPRRLYTELKQCNTPDRICGKCVSMLIDEEGLLKEGIEPNLIGSYLYETENHGSPIMGNILFVGEVWHSDGIDFCGIEESVFKDLKVRLESMIFTMKLAREVYAK